MIIKPVSEHVREHRSLLASAERDILIWIAERLPNWVTSDQLTLLGLLSMVAAGGCYWVSRWNRTVLPLVVVALALNWLGDSLDGTIARVRNAQRPRYGFYVDHVIDVLGMLFLFGGLALSGFMSPQIALGLLVAYLMVSAEVFLATCVHGIFRLASLGFGPTELRIVLSVGTLCLLCSPVVRIAGMGPFRLFDVGGTVAIAGLGLAFLLSTIRNTLDLYRAEPLAH
jgi:archaetidylinositol phosphate synthase